MTEGFGWGPSVDLEKARLENVELRAQIETLQQKLEVHGRAYKALRIFCASMQATLGRRASELYAENKNLLDELAATATDLEDLISEDQEADHERDDHDDDGEYAWSIVQAYQTENLRLGRRAEEAEANAKAEARSAEEWRGNCLTAEAALENVKANAAILAKKLAAAERTVLDYSRNVEYWAQRCAEAEAECRRRRAFRAFSVTQGVPDGSPRVDIYFDPKWK